MRPSEKEKEYKCKRLHQIIATSSAEQSTTSASTWAKLISGSFGSTLTALLVTPLEVVKVRQQSQALTYHGMPSNASLCPRGCGTFVLNNGLNECLVPKCAVPYFDPSTGRLKESLEVKNSRGTFATVRHIFMKEGFQGVYAGLGPTLVMGVPNTVLYFITYDELSTYLGSVSESSFVAAFAGASARIVASVTTAPLELIRTRQAARVGAAEPAIGMLAEFKTMIRRDGFFSLYKGLSPTLFRDVPFSAIYWLSIERLRKIWRDSKGDIEISAWQQGGQALVNGSISGMIAAACTTPLDVVKTLRQVESRSAKVEPAFGGHQGAVIYNMKANGHHATGTFPIMQSIVKNEGFSGLWRGNQARMIKVAPACAVMIASYELGKRFLTEEAII